MKTYEQITADVLARRDAYLAQREQKRRAAKKYAAASLLMSELDTHQLLRDKIRLGIPRELSHAAAVVIDGPAAVSRRIHRRSIFELDGGHQLSPFGIFLQYIRLCLIQIKPDIHLII